MITFCEHDEGISIECHVADKFLSNTYLVRASDTSDVVIIDPHTGDSLETSLSSLRPSSVLIILTHEHFDHTTGVNRLVDKYGAKILAQSNCAAKIISERNNRTLSIMSRTRDAKSFMKHESYSIKADMQFDDTFVLDRHGMAIRLTHTPGHSLGSCCVRIGKYLFVGDSALLDIPTVTRFPSGSQEQYDKITVPYLLSLSKDTVIMPGHGGRYTLGDVEWREGRFTKNV